MLFGGRRAVVVVIGVVVMLGRRGPPNGDAGNRVIVAGRFEPVGIRCCFCCVGSRW